MYKKVNELLGTKYNSDSEINWLDVSCDYKLSESFIKKFKNKVDWEYISHSQILSESFIREFEDRVNWDYISSCQILSENFIQEFEDKVNWGWISCYQSLSESFIREFQDKVDWIWISENQILSWDFILKFENKVNWCNISRRQPFIDPNYEKINKKFLEYNKLYQLYQETKDKGWFVGYVKEDKISIEFIIYSNEFFNIKSRIYWKDLLTINKIRIFEILRQIKKI